MTRILFQQDGGGLGTYGDLVIATTEGPGSFHPGTTQRVVDEVLKLRRTSHRDRLIYVYVAGEESGMPDQESRRIAAQLQGHVDTVVGVHEGAGFRASVVRAIVTGITQLGQHKVRPRIVDSVRTAGTMLHESFPELGTEDEIAGWIEDVRAAARATL